MTRNRIDGEPVRVARTMREAFPHEATENAAGIDGPPEPYLRGWRAVLAFVLARNVDLTMQPQPERERT